MQGRRRAHVIVGGHVQGVYFRASAHEQALPLGVDGWVCNRADGRVEAVFEGDPDAVESMVRWCRQGPPGSHVETVEVWDEEPEGESGFRVRY